jgi:hypothetical protein
MSSKEIMHTLVKGAWFAVDSSMLEWGRDKCVLSDKLMLHRLHSNIQKESSANKQKHLFYYFRLF